ncbi:hypothetical protein ACQKWADRAFT_331500 [Trichoderma austrokoningii]
MTGSSRPPQTCLYCRKQKRRCDRQAPRCGTCRRAGRECEYIANRNEELVRMKNRIAYLETVLRRDASSNTSGSPRTTGPLDTSRPALQLSDILASAPEAQALLFSEPAPSALLPMSYFLDTTISPRELDGYTSPFMTIPQELLSHTGTSAAAREIADSYFDKIHSWLPFIWKRKISQFTASVDIHPDPGMTTLLAAMKMITSAAGSPLGNQLYIIVKGYLTVLEDSGLLTIGVLQAGILITLYEIGHGIYPAAYMSIGRCARLGHMMGLHGNSPISKSFKQPTSWGETEEIRRTWFAVLILDRYTNIGLEGRPLSAGEFADNDMLPCDTKSWDQGEPAPSQPLFIHGVTTLSGDPFSRACQVAHLLGRIIDHRDDSRLAGPPRFITAAQLLRTLNSLLHLLETELGLNSVAFSLAYAIAFSAKVALLTKYSCTETNQRVNCVEETDMQVLAIGEFRKMPAEIVRFGDMLQLTESINSDHLSPLICDCLYQGAVTALWYFKESGSEEMAGYQEALETYLRSMQTRWNIAKEYLTLVEKQR